MSGERKREEEARRARWKLGSRVATWMSTAPLRLFSPAHPFQFPVQLSLRLQQQLPHFSVSSFFTLPGWHWQPGNHHWPTTPNDDCHMQQLMARRDEWRSGWPTNIGFSLLLHQKLYVSLSTLKPPFRG